MVGEEDMRSLGLPVLVWDEDSVWHNHLYIALVCGLIPLEGGNEREERKGAELTCFDIQQCGTCVIFPSPSQKVARRLLAV